ncbi:hypothetical protein EMGBS15_01760 [Filimonas sp.]|nr:hypothetical protein EMGBS15_01760 [Filimonas sp.]
MLSLKERSRQLELLDMKDIPFDDIRQNLIELNTINTLLGGHQITLDGVKPFLIPDFTEPIHIVEIGSGGGDNLRVIADFLKEKEIQYKLTGIDLKEECVAYARAQSPGIEFICSDYKDVVFNQKPDLIFNSLFCHHFTNEELIHVLQWMRNHAAKGFFINDLDRNLLAWYSIKILTGLFSKSYLVKNDAPLSVARSFKRKDWVSIFKAAGIDDYRIEWKWAFRYLVSWKA